MTRRKPLFYSAMLLTAVNLALRMAGTVFQVYLSRKIGPEGIGLLQLTMSVGSLTLIAGIGGIRTAAMYLTAEELGRKRPWGCGVFCPAAEPIAFFAAWELGPFYTFLLRKSRKAGLETALWPRRCGCSPAFSPPPAGAPG